MSKGAYTPEFTPLARPGDVVELDDGERSQQYEVTKLTTLPAIDISTISVSKNSVKRDVKLTNLEIWEGWVAQYRMPRIQQQLPTDVNIEVDQGGGQEPLFQTRNQRGDLDDTDLYEESTNSQTKNLAHLAELFVHEDTPPRFTVTNNQGSSIDLDLTFAGFALGLREVGAQKVGNRTPVYAPVESVRGN